MNRDLAKRLRHLEREFGLIWEQWEGLPQQEIPPQLRNEFESDLEEVRETLHKMVQFALSESSRPETEDETLQRLTHGGEFELFKDTLSQTIKKSGLPFSEVRQAIKEILQSMWDEED